MKETREKGRQRGKMARSNLSESLLSLVRVTCADLLRKSERWSVPAHTQINDNAVLTSSLGRDTQAD